LRTPGCLEATLDDSDNFDAAQQPKDFYAIAIRAMAISMRCAYGMIIKSHPYHVNGNFLNNGNSCQKNFQRCLLDDDTYSRHVMTIPILLACTDT
jgi:hypothetical protein